MRIGFIGAGKVGYSLGKLFSESGIQVTGYYSLHEESSKEAAAFTNTKFFQSYSELLNESDTLFLTVPDGQITPVFKELVSYGVSDKIICHCSGALSSQEAFPEISASGAFGYSLHPLFPVSNKYESYRELKDAFFCVEGHEKYLDDWKKIFSGMGIRTLMIKPSDKVKYHMACAVASNLVCAVIDEAVQLFTECGFDEQSALSALSPLIKSNIEHILSDGCVNALTGPAERADCQTVSKHLKCLSERNHPNDKNIYKSASLRCADIAKRKHPEKDYSELEHIIQSS